MPKPKVALLYCGSSFTKSLWDKLASLDVLPVMFPSNTPAEDVMSVGPMAIMVTGSPMAVNHPKAPRIDPQIYNCGVPMLGICYGMQLMAYDFGVPIKRMVEPEKECVKLKFTDEPSLLYRDFGGDAAPVWMYHVCQIAGVPEGFVATGYTSETEIASMEDEERALYAVQYHPEHIGKDPSSQAGTAILWNFLNGICGYEIE